MDHEGFKLLSVGVVRELSPGVDKAEAKWSRNGDSTGLLSIIWIVIPGLGSHTYGVHRGPEPNWRRELSAVLHAWFGVFLEKVTDIDREAFEFLVKSLP